MNVTTTNLAWKRLFWLFMSALVTALLAVLTREYETTAFYPFIYFVLTTARDYLDKSIPNR